MRVRFALLENIKRYRGRHVFDAMADGVLLLLGRNGRGKTTIPQAIGLTFFGVIPPEFKGAAGESLVGFVSHGESQGTIRIIVEVSEELTVTAQSTLEADGDDLDRKNLVRTDLWRGAWVDPDTLPPESDRILQNATIKTMRAWVRDALKLPLDVRELYQNLLAPPQTGGLTQYLSKTPGDREKQTEEMLGLQRVKQVAKRLSGRVKDLKRQAEESSEQLDLELSAAADAYPMLAEVHGVHVTTKHAFEALTDGALCAAFTPARAPVVRSLVDASRELVAARRKVSEEAKRLTQANARRRAAADVVTTLRAEEQASKQVQESERATEQAAALKPRKALKDTLVAQFDELNEKVKARDRALAELREATRIAKIKRDGIAKAKEKREAERDSVAKTRDKKSDELEKKRKVLENWDQESELADQTLERLAEVRDDLNALGRLHAALEGVPGAEVANELTTRLKGALSANRLPQGAGPVAELLVGRLSELEPVDDEDDSHSRIAQWVRENELARKTAEGERRTLDKRKLDVETAQANFEVLQQEWKKQLQHFDTLDSDEAAEDETLEQEQAQLAERTEGILQKHAGLDDELAEKKKARDDEDLRKDVEAYHQAQGVANKLEDRKAALAELTEAVATAIAAVDLEAPPSGDDLDGWVARAEALEAAVTSAQAAVGEARDDREKRLTVHRDASDALARLDALESSLLQRLRLLHERRAAHAQLSVLYDEVLAKLPKAVARRVVESVSTLANDFFHRLFVQPSVAMDLQWDPNTYDVRIHRGGGSIPARHCSGGEKMATGISLNLALLHFMAPQVRWLVLDEPTASLDEENRGGLRDFVETLDEPGPDGRRIFDQLLFISHESKLFEGMGQSLIFDDDGL